MQCQNLIVQNHYQNTRLENIDNTQEFDSSFSFNFIYFLN